METIGDYKILEKLSETRVSIVYRGCKGDAPDTVIIKALKTGPQSQTALAGFKQEFQLIRDIDLPGVIKALDIIEHQGRLAIVMEDFDGVSLKKVLEKKRFDTKAFLETAIPLAETFGSLHQRNITHRNIKPHNIFIHLNTKEVKITDFGVSSILIRENQEIYHPDVIQHTLPYMSPEQTGRMNRPVDYRTDLYSLGITFYEMLMGIVPFTSEDPMEVIHSHLAIKPCPPIEMDATIPAAISNIIMRLLLKTAEERYQNAFGLMADLRECLRRFEEKGSIEPFVLA